MRPSLAGGTVSGLAGNHGVLSLIGIRKKYQLGNQRALTGYPVVIPRWALIGYHKG